MEMPLIRLSLAAKYAIDGMAAMAQRPGEEFFYVTEIASSRKLPKNFLGKVFQKLTHRGLLSSRRGPGGGYALARQAEDITLAEIVECAQEPAPQAPCLLAIKGCDKANPCSIHQWVIEADRILRQALSQTSLADAALPRSGHGVKDKCSQGGARWKSSIKI